MNLIDYLDRGCALYPERACFIQDGRTTTYREVRELTCRVASALAGAGFRAGDAGAVLSPNDGVAFTCALGMVRAGGVWVPANPKSAIGELAHVLAFCECKVLFYHSAFKAAVAEFRAQCPCIRLYICLDEPDGEVPGLDAWIRPFEPQEIAPACDPEAIVALAATGGTTGLPKAVMLANRNMDTLIANTLVSMPFDEPPVYLAAAPLTHAAGTMVLAFMAIGGTTIVQTRVDAQEILKAIPAHRVTTLLLPPTVIYVLLSQPNVREFDYSSLKYFIYVASPMSADKLSEAIDVFGPVMTQLYGQAEAPMTITFMGPKEHLVADPVQRSKRLRSCGRPTPFVRVAIMDDDGNLLGNDQAGEIVVQGDLVMKGYLKNPEATAEAGKSGWHHTGDIGYRDRSGYYYIVDRKKDMIISGGFNLYPNEIEQVISSHKAVLDCAVIGVPDEKWGEAVKAIVQCRPGCDVGEEELLALCKAKLGSVKTPKSVDFVADLPRSPVGKVLKKTLRAAYWAGNDRNIA